MFKRVTDGQTKQVNATHIKSTLRNIGAHADTTPKNALQPQRMETGDERTMNKNMASDHKITKQRIKIDEKCDPGDTRTPAPTTEDLALRR
jgi:hypothetical protein